MTFSINLLASFPLTEEHEVFNLQSTAWIPVMVLGAILVLGLVCLALARYVRTHKKTQKLAPKSKKSTQTIRTETYSQLDQLQYQLENRQIAREQAALQISKICRDYIDQIQLLQSKSMTLREVKAHKLPVWIDNVMSQCYEHEFSSSNHDPTKLLQVLTYAREQVGLWQ